MNQQDTPPPGPARPEPPIATDTNPSGAAGAELAAMRHDLETMRAALAVASDRERVLVHELQHRVRNMLAVIRSIYRRSREIDASQDEFGQHFQGRLDALARHHVHAGLDWPGIDLEDMLRDELLKSRCLDGPACVMNGPPVLLRGKSAELMGLAIHELTTNSIKFGALAQGGTLAIDWSLEDGDPWPLLRFRWAEAGASLVSSTPRPSGFGRELIEDALPYQLGARTSFELRPGGLVCAIELPLRETDAASTRPYPSDAGLAV